MSGSTQGARCECALPGIDDAHECMVETLQPGRYSDQRWIDAGAPSTCRCRCHDCCALAISGEEQAT